MPSRDMIVRAVTPPGAYGRVFGFVSSGFNIGVLIVFYLVCAELLKSVAVAPSVASSRR
jgi:hypothetical protein